MITDEQGREWLIRKLYDNGWRYCVCMASGNIYLTSEKPYIYPNGVFSVADCKRVDGINGLKGALFNELKPNEILNLAEELGIVDWYKVPVDTPILVKDFEEQECKKRYFAFFEDETIYAWEKGATSWSVKNEGAIPWKYAKLAEV